MLSLRLGKALLSFAAIIGVPALSIAEAGPPEGARLAEVKVTAGETVFHADLLDNETSRDFVSKLPLTVTMTRSGEREYHGRPSDTLSTAGPKQTFFLNGDLGYWAPGGYLAVFLDSTKKPQIEDLIVIGKVTTDLAVIRGLGTSEEMRFEVSVEP